MSGVHFVNVPLIIARAEDGRDVYLYGGAIVPTLQAGEVERLSKAGFIEKLPEPVAVEAHDAPAPTRKK